MSMIKIEFPADDKAAAAAFSQALATYAESKCRCTGKAPELGMGYEQKVEEPVHAGEQVDDDGEEQTTTGAGAQPAADVKVDDKGVAFNPAFCGKAAQPFYTSGKRSGQWKKLKGVSEEDYDAWYAANLANVAPAASPEPAPINTAGAFGGQQQQPAPVQSDAPTDIGSFMGWVSEKQAAGALTQDAINAAWIEAGVEMVDLFNKTDAEVQESLKKIYGVLSEKVTA